MVSEKACLTGRPKLGRYLKWYGRGCMAYSTLQAGLSHFVEPGVGYIAYLRYRHPWWAPRGMRLVLGDPIADPGSHDQLLSDFLEDPTPAVFLQTSAAFARLLTRHTAEVFRCGVETELRLTDFHLRGKNKAHLRRWLNKAVSEKIRITEQPIDEIPSGAITTVSRDWLARKGGRELALLTRPLMLEQEQDVRYFWAWIGDLLVGMVIFDPLYGDGRVVGYYQNHVRVSHRAPHGTSDLATWRAIERFRSEGIDRLSLGLSPLGGMTEIDLTRNKWAARMLKTIYHRSWFYGFQANLFHKRKYDGVERPVYYASTGGGSFSELIAVLKVTRVL